MDKMSNDLKQYLSLNNPTEYSLPTIKAYSFRSDLFHEKMIENIAKASLNKMVFKNSNEENNRENKIKASDLKLSEIEILEEKLKKRKKLKIFPQIEIFLQENKMMSLLSITNRKTYYHDYKIKSNWGSLRESYAAALFYQTELIEKMNQKKKLHIWDPFCGAGTLLIEVFTIIFKLQSREIKHLASEVFTNFLIHDKEKFKIFLKEEMKINSSHFIDVENKFQCNFISSDINNKSINAISDNLKTAKFHKYKIYSLNQILNPDLNYSEFVNPVIYHEKINNVFDIFLGDFETIGNNVIFSDYNIDKKFNIFTHIPYGISSYYDDKTKIKKLYERFGKFLRKYNDLLDDVYIIVNKRAETDPLNFKHLSQIKWISLIDFTNNGINVELLKMIKE